VYAYVHDAYHPLPAQQGEGRPGSGLIFRWQEREGEIERVVVHAIAVDEYGAIAGWDLQQEGGWISLVGPGGRIGWRLHVVEQPLNLTVRHTQCADGVVYRVSEDDRGKWALRAE
jgi:hypothetical protein